MGILGELHLYHALTRLLVSCESIVFRHIPFMSAHHGIVYFDSAVLSETPNETKCIQNRRCLRRATKLDGELKDLVTAT